MAQDIGQFFTHLAEQLGKVTSIVGTQGVAQVFSKFEGDIKQFKNWIQSIEKYARITNLDDKEKKNVAFQTAQGPVSDFIQRYMNDAPDGTWDDLKKRIRLKIF